MRPWAACGSGYGSSCPLGYDCALAAGCLRARGFRCVRHAAHCGTGYDVDWGFSTGGARYIQPLVDTVTYQR